MNQNGWKVKMTKQRQNQRVNKWIVFAISTLINMVDFGLILSIGALFLAMMDKFQTDRASTATVQSILIGVTLTFGIFSGIFITNFGLPLVTFIASFLVPLGLSVSFFAQHVTFLYVSIGTVTGIGVSMAYISSVVVLGHVFSGSQHVLCLTVVQTSHGVMAIIYPYFLDWSTKQFGLNGTFLILGGLCCNTFLLFLVCMLNNSQETNMLDSSKKYANSKETTVRRERKLVKQLTTLFENIKTLATVPFVLITIATAFSLASLDGFLELMLDMAAWKRLSLSQGLFSFLVFNSSSAASSIMPGLLKQKKGYNSCIYPIFSAVTGSIGQLMVNFSQEIFVYLIGISLTGICYGGLVSSCLSAVVRIVHQDQVPVASGLLVTTEGLLAFGVGPLYGTVRDKTGSYESVLLTITTILVFASLVFIFALMYRRRSKHKEAATEIFNIHL